jgi:hypothetical protein
MASIRANLVPGLVLWAVAATVVVIHGFVPASRGLFDTVAGWKAAGGFGYSIGATALFAGVLPFVFQKAMPSTRAAATWATLVFTTVLWAYRGFEIDLFYRFQALLFGSDPTPAAVAAKVAVDLFLYNVLWAAHLQLLTYHWKNSGFRPTAFSGYPWGDYFRQRLPAAILSTWAVWLPVLILVYSLPSDLQIPLFNLAACFWALVMGALTSRPGSAPVSPPLPETA